LTSNRKEENKRDKTKEDWNQMLKENIIVESIKNIFEFIAEDLFKNKKFEQFKILHTLLPDNKLFNINLNKFKIFYIDGLVSIDEYKGDVYYVDLLNKYHQYFIKCGMQIIEIDL
jgi:hypothetical protein